METEVGTPAADHPVRMLTRVVAAIIVPVLVAAFIMLYLLPDDTEGLFAWPVRPHMTAMMLGATYLGGAYFFTRVLTARRWHHVSLGFLPVAALCLILGAATALHWDRFTQGHVSFILWVILYFTLPVVLPVVWYHNRPDGTTRLDHEALLSRPVSLTFGILGAVFTGVGLLLLFVPHLMIPTWPWELSPLTARVVSSLFVLTGLIALSISVDRRWTAVRFILQAQTVAVVLILLAVVLARDDFDWTAPGSWTFTAGLVVVFALVVTVLVRQRGKGDPRAMKRPVETAES
jgi:peptidoglycan/LPS O-acetylase OafA/YrhL